MKLKSEEKMLQEPGEVGILCIECKKEYEENDMKKIFVRGEGICKKCWNFDEGDE